MNTQTPQYPKMTTVWERDYTKRRTLIPNRWATAAISLLRHIPWEATEKVDGTNVRIVWPGQGDYEIRGRTDRADVPMGIVKYIRDRVSSPDLVEVFGGVPATIYGEGFGAQIQEPAGSRYGDTQKFIVFDVRIHKHWLPQRRVQEIASALKLSRVPSLGMMSLVTWMGRAQRQYTLGAPATSFVAKDGTLPMEGMVFRPMIELLDSSGERIICKVKVRDFERREKA